MEANHSGSALQYGPPEDGARLDDARRQASDARVEIGDDDIRAIASSLLKDRLEVVGVPPCSETFVFHPDRQAVFPLE